MSFARVRALVVIGVLAVAAVVFVVVALVRDTQGGAAADGGCPEGSVLAELTLPEPDQVTVRILNGTTTPGLAEKVTTDFKNRRFQAKKPAEAKKKLDGVATITFGPRAVGAAQLIRAYFLDEAKPQYNPKRTTSDVDIVIGSQYQQLATTTEVNQSLIELGEPKLPPGACAAPEAKAAG
jgi:hypothetical protein